MPRFNAMDLIGPRTTDQEITTLDIDDLIPNPKNRDIGDLTEIKEAIRSAGGVKQPLLVIQRGDKYRIIAGHRRHGGCRLLVEDGETKYEKVPCIIEHELSEDDEEILLILLNVQKEKTPYEKMQDAIRLKDLLKEKKTAEKLPGRVRDMVAESLQETPTQIARYESIDNNLCPELKNKFKAGEIGVTAAYEASRLPEGKQKEVAASGKRTAREIKNVSETDTKREAPPEPRESQVAEAEITLLPCPFCGGIATINTIEPHNHKLAIWMPDYNGGTFIECNQCTCAISAKNNTEAAEAWNRRTK